MYAKISPLGVVVTFINIFVFLLCILWSILFFDNINRSKFYIDEDGRTIFYPDDINKGYVASNEQIEQSVKAFRKCFLFNIAGYKKGLAKIFANSDMIEKKLPAEIFRKNQAKNMSWLLLLSWLLIDIICIVAVLNFKLLLIPVLGMSIQTVFILFLKISNK